MSGEVEKCPILHVRPKFDVFTLLYYRKSQAPVLNFISKQYTPETKLQYIYQKFLPMPYQAENPGKCWLKFNTLPILIKEIDKSVYQTFFSSDIFGHQIKAK